MFGHVLAQKAVLSVPDAEPLNVEPGTREGFRGGIHIDLLQVGSNCRGQRKHLIIRGAKHLEKHSAPPAPHPEGRHGRTLEVSLIVL